MQFQKGHLYHFYNQGNNRRVIFFKRENYYYFLQKVQEYILPYCDLLAYCLMPNHFHFMVQVNEVELPVKSESSDDSKSSDDSDFEQIIKYRTLNNSIAILLRSYTRAINKQQNSRGSLFRPKTKAVCLTASEGAVPLFLNTRSGIEIRVEHLEKQYPQMCYNYIHQNPVQTGLVKKIKDWEFSSAPAYYDPDLNALVNKEVTYKDIALKMILLW